MFEESSPPTSLESAKPSSPVPSSPVPTGTMPTGTLAIIVILTLAILGMWGLVYGLLLARS